MGTDPSIKQDFVLHFLSKSHDFVLTSASSYKTNAQWKKNGKWGSDGEIQNEETLRSTLALLKCFVLYLKGLFGTHCLRVSEAGWVGCGGRLRVS